MTDYMELLKQQMKQPPVKQNEVAAKPVEASPISQGEFARTLQADIEQHRAEEITKIEEEKKNAAKKLEQEETKRKQRDAEQKAKDEEDAAKSRAAELYAPEIVKEAEIKKEEDKIPTPKETTPSLEPVVVTPPEDIVTPPIEPKPLEPSEGVSGGISSGLITPEISIEQSTQMEWLKNNPAPAVKNSKEWVNWVRKNPSSTPADLANANLYEKFNYNIEGIEPYHIEQSFSPSMQEVAKLKASNPEFAKLSDGELHQRVTTERLDRAGLLHSAGYGEIKHEFNGVDIDGKPSIVKVNVDQYWDIQNKSPIDRLPDLIKLGILPEGTKPITDVETYNKEHGTKHIEDFPYALPDEEKYVMESVKREGELRVLINIGVIDSDGLLDIEKVAVAIDKGDIKEQSIKDAGFGNAYQEYKQLIKNREVSLQELKNVGVINDGNYLDLEKAVRAGIINPKQYSDAGYIVTDDDIKKILNDIKQEQYYSDWTAKELLDGYRVKDGIYYGAPFGVKGDGHWIPAPQWAEKKIIDEQNKTIIELQPYIVTKESPIYPPDIMDRIIKIYPKFKDNLPQKLLETVKVYDIVKMREDKLSEDKMMLVGLTQKDIANADEYILQQKGLDALREKYEAIENKLEPYKKYTFGSEHMPYSTAHEVVPYYDVGKALLDKKVTEQELKDMGYNDEQIKEVRIRAEVGLKAYIPIYATIALWSVSGGWEKGMQIIGDALLVLPLAKIGATAIKGASEALRVGIVAEQTALMRVGQLAKNIVQISEQSVIGMVKFPYQLAKEPIKTLGDMLQSTIFPFVHPIESAKGIYAIVTGKVFIGEPYLTRAISLFTNVKAIPNAAIVLPTDGKGVQRLFINGGLTQEEALDATQKMQLMLSSMLANGQKIPAIIQVPVMENGVLRFTIDYPTSRAMRDLGIAVTGTPFAERIFTGAAEPVTVKVYFSNAMTYEWTSATARGITVPEVVEMGRGGAIIKDMKINRFFDPVEKVYSSTIEMEMTVPTGTQIVTSRDEALMVLKANGNTRVFPSIVEDIIPQENIVNAIRNAQGKVFEIKPINFEEIKSIPKKSASWLEKYIRENDIVVAGSTAERTWADTIHVPEDIDLHSLRNVAKLDAERMAIGISDTSGIQTRVQTPEMVGSDVYRVQKYNTDTKEWEQMLDILDEASSISAWRNVKQYPIVDNNGIKMEHPLQQAEKLTNKLQDYVDGKIMLENHRGHAKRFAWMSEKMLDTSGGKLTGDDTEVLNHMATRVNYGDYGNISKMKLTKLKIGGLMDEVIDKIAPRRIRIRLPDGSIVKTTCF